MVNERTSTMKCTKQVWGLILADYVHINKKFKKVCPIISKYTYM